MLDLIKEIRSFARRDRPHTLEMSGESRRRLESALLSDRLSDELKQMVEVGSGCGFLAMLRVLRLLDSPTLKSRQQQQELISSFKTLFGSLTADMTPVDIVSFCEKFDLGVRIIILYYLVDLGTEERVREHLNSRGGFHGQFKIVPFHASDKIFLEPGQVAIIGVENQDVGHYICSDESDIVLQNNPGGASELRKYLALGFRVTEILIFEK